MNELAGMLNQEEARLKQHGQHSVHFTTQGAERKGKKPRKGMKRTQSKTNEPNQGSQTYKKERNNDKCHFCKKSGHYSET